MSPNDFQPVWTSGAPVEGEVLDWLTGHRLTARALDSTVLDGRAIVVSGSFDRTLRMWDVATGALIRILGGVGKWFSQVRCATIGGRQIAVAASADRTVGVFDLASGEVIHTLKGHTGGALAVDVTEVDGVPVAVVGCGDKKIRVWNLATGKRIRIITVHETRVDALDCVTLDGKAVAVARENSGTFGVWDLSTGESVRTFDRPAIASVCAEVDGRVLLAHCERLHTIVVTDLATDTEVRRVTSGGPIRSSLHLKLIDEVPTLLFAAESTIRTFDLRDGAEIIEFDNDETGVTAALTVVDHEGRAVVVGSQGSGTLRAWDLSTGEPLHTVTGHHRPVRQLEAIEADGHDPMLLSWSHQADLRVWNAKTGEHLRTLSGFPRQIQALDHTEADGRPVAVVGHYERCFHLWDLTTGKPIPPQTPSYQGHSLDHLRCGHVNGELVVAVHGYRTVKVWNAQCDKLLHDIPTGFLRAIACTEVDGMPMLITNKAGGTIHLIDLATGKPAGGARVHDSLIQSMTTTVVDGSAVLVSGGADNTVRVLDLSTRTLTHTFTGHTDEVDIVAVGELDGRPIAASGSRDHTVRVWDLFSGKQTHVFTLPAAVPAVAIGDGKVYTAHGREIRAYPLREAPEACGRVTRGVVSNG